jgi:Holliday junction resolvase RusA-like endonuclease
MTLSLTIPGAPRTKKNSGRIVRCGGFPKMLPSKAFEDWNRDAQQLIRLALPPNWGPLHAPVNCRALFYRKADIGDAVGFYQALADALEEAEVVFNDRLIVSWDGSRMLKDAARPRIEVTLEVI